MRWFGKFVLAASAALLAFALSFGCSSTGWEPGTAEAALTPGVCTPLHSVRTVDVTFAGGACARYTLPPTGGPWFFPSSGQVVQVDTGTDGAAWVCDNLNPAGFTSSPWAPCWVSGVANGVRRVRGAPNGAPSNPYAILSYGPTSRAMGAFVGLSFVLSRGTLPGPPVCPYVSGGVPAPTHWHSCTTRADSGLQDWYSNNDPADGNNCCNTSAQWPGGASGAPCADHANGSGAYAVENYGGCPAF